LVGRKSSRPIGGKRGNMALFSNASGNVKLLVRDFPECAGATGREARAGKHADACTRGEGKRRLEEKRGFAKKIGKIPGAEPLDTPFSYGESVNRDKGEKKDH